MSASRAALGHAAPGRTFAGLRRRHPQWWFVGIAAATWLAPLALHRDLGEGHAAHRGLAAVLVWTVMSVAMMTPVALPALRYVALNSLRGRRRRSMTAFAGAYLAVWIAVGSAATAAVAATAALPGMTGGRLFAGTLAVAALWQVTGEKRRALNACGRAVPIRPFGARADASCARYGAMEAWRCVRACWALMLVPAVATGGAFLWMAAVTALILAEERRVGRRHLPRASAAALALFAATVALA